MIRGALAGAVVVVVVAVVVGAGMIAPRAARANAAAMEFNSPESAAGTFLATPTAIEVEREDLAIRCDDGGRDYGAGFGREVACRFDATYHLYNPAPRVEEATGIFYGGRDVAIMLDGRDVAATLPLDQVRALDHAVGGNLDIVVPRERMQYPSLELTTRRPRTGFAIKVAAGARAALVFSGRLGPVEADNPRLYGGYTIAAYATRHPLLGTRAERDANSVFTYFLAPLRTWAGARTIAIEVSAPARWPLHLAPLAGAQAPWTFARDGDRAVARAETSAAPGGDLTMTVTVPGPKLFSGGPFVAAGGAFGREGGLHLRTGYEASGPPWLLYSLALETNARDRFAAAAVVEVATPSLVYIIPSLAIGAGPIVERHHERTSAGARLQTTMSFGYVSAVLLTDFIEGVTRWGLLGQVSM